MIPQDFDYSAPATLAEALALLADNPDARVLAGGMSLVPLMKLRLAAPDHVVDLAHVPGLNEIREEAGGIHIGAMATHYDVESSALLRHKCPLLPEAAAHIGDVQVRNMGTVGGSIAHNDPAADYPAALFALAARIVLAGVKGERTLDIADFLVDTMTTALEPGEIVKEIVVPVEQAGTGVSYQKLAQPASGFAIVGAAVRMRKANGSPAFLRVGITGLAAKAFRAAKVEQLYLGGAGARAAAAAAAEGADANSDLHASAEYRRHMAQVYTRRALEEALQRIS